MNNYSWKGVIYIVAAVYGIIVCHVGEAMSVEPKLLSYIIVGLVGVSTIYYIISSNWRLGPWTSMKFHIWLATIVLACSFFIFSEITGVPIFDTQVRDIVFFSATIIIGMMAIILLKFGR